MLGLPLFCLLLINLLLGFLHLGFFLSCLFFGLLLTGLGLSLLLSSGLPFFLLALPGNPLCSCFFNLVLTRELLGLALLGGLLLGRRLFLALFYLKRLLLFELGVPLFFLLPM